MRGAQSASREGFDVTMHLVGGVLIHRLIEGSVVVIIVQTSFFDD